MANLSEKFQRRQLPGSVEHGELYPVHLSQAKIRSEQRTNAQPTGGFEESDWRERLTESLPDWPAGYDAEE